MKHQYARLGRLSYKLIRPVWLFFNKHKTRVRVVLVRNGKVFLVVNWLSRQRWRLPGGGIRKGEAPEDSAIRELSEELRFKIGKDRLRLLGDFEMSDFGYPIKAVVFMANVEAKTFNLRTAEIIDGQWFDINQLPQDRDSVVDLAISLYRENVDNPEHRT